MIKSLEHETDLWDFCSVKVLLWPSETWGSCWILEGITWPGLLMWPQSVKWNEDWSCSSQQTNTKVSSRSNSEKLPAPADVSRELGFKKWATKTKRYFTKVLLNFPLPFNFSSLLTNMIPIWNWNFKLYLAHQKSMTYKKECWNWRGWWGFSFWQWRGLFGWLLLLLWRRIL